MFKIAVQTGGPEEIYGIEECYQIIKEAGFDGVDVNCDHLLSYEDVRKRAHGKAFEGTDRDVLPYFEPWKKGAEKWKLDNFQAHAPFPCYVKDGGDYNDYLIEVLRKSIIGCDYIGCRNLIVHPFFLGYQDRLSKEAEWDLNIESYSKLIPAAKEYGVTICLENMFSGYRGKMYNAIGSDASEACRYIDTLNGIAGGEVFGFCFDTGHNLLVGKDIQQTMVELGSRIKTFHVHDNDGINDLHMPPYTGILDWNNFIEGLKRIRFNTTLSFETFAMWRTVDPEIAAHILRVIAETGRMFARRAGE
ncbi:MAG: sugar phosphate isomerase/epimerase family protein [Christensenellales bacterium]|jgi:sugar phosphate isomerase/epimerase